MGGRSLTPGEASALSEAIDILRGAWDVADKSHFRSML